MFQIENPKPEIRWRNLILFGRNSATYKFAFAKTLLSLIEDQKTVVTLNDLVEPYADFMVEHIKSDLGQGNNGQFLRTLKEYSDGKVERPEMLAVTKAEGFKNVIDAFQNVNNGAIENKFYDGTYTGLNTKLTLTDQLYSLKDIAQFQNLEQEVEARWRLVETAWNLNVAANNLVVEYDNFDNELFFQTSHMRRVNVSNARDALSGYQEGKCFYCRRDYSIQKNSSEICHVDHFLPHLNKMDHAPANINGIWNLVLACKLCNGSGQKGSKIPKIKYLAKLQERNQYYITSNHPLAETIINQTGKTVTDRISFLRTHYQISKNNCLIDWETEEFHD